MGKNKSRYKGRGKPIHTPTFEEIDWFLGDTKGSLHRMGERMDTSFTRAFNENRKGYYAIPSMEYLEHVFMEGMADTFSLKATTNNMSSEDKKKAAEKINEYFGKLRSNGVILFPEYSRNKHSKYRCGDEARVTAHIINGKSSKKLDSTIRKIFSGYGSGTNLVVVDYGVDCIKDFLNRSYGGSSIISLAARNSY